MNTDERIDSSNGEEGDLIEEPPIVEEEPESVYDLGTVDSSFLPPERPAIAYIIVVAFVVSIGLCFLYASFKDFKEGLELFKTVAAVLGGPLGYVLGYYFRISEKL